MKLNLTTLELQFLNEALNRTPETDVRKLRNMASLMKILQPVLDGMYEQMEKLKDSYKTEEYEKKVDDENEEAGWRLEKAKKIPSDMLEKVNDELALLTFDVEFGDDMVLTTYLINKLNNFPAVYKGVDKTPGLKGKDDVLEFISLLDKAEKSYNENKKK